MYYGFIRAATWNLSETGQRLTDEELGYTFYGNRPVGLVRLRQLRVGKDTCVVHRELQSVAKECYGYYSVKTQSVKDYGKVSGYTLQLYLSLSYLTCGTVIDPDMGEPGKGKGEGTVSR